MTLAGLWDEWRNKATGEVLKSCTITEPNQARADVREGRVPFGA
jgi:putative SOS response-associated peptidase YedK